MLPPSSSSLWGTFLRRLLHVAVQPPRLTKFALHAPKYENLRITWRRLLRRILVPQTSRSSLFISFIVEVEFADGSVFNLSAEFLRIHSPAVNSKIRSIDGEKVIFGRRHVGIMSAEPVGNYGIRVLFDDLHKTGIYTWDYFYNLGSNKFTLMRNYIKTLRKHGLSREPRKRVTQ